VPASASSPGTFQPVGKTIQPGLENAIVLRDGSVLITGGGMPTDTGFVAYASAERFDPTTNTFSAVTPMTTPRQAHAAVLLQDGRVLVVGGWDGQSSRSSAEEFDPATGGFTLAGRMAEVRSGPSATLLRDGRVLVIGGWNDSSGPGPGGTAELFDPVTGLFSKTGSPVGIRGANTALALSDGRVAVLGSEAGKPRVEIYDPTSGAFSRQGALLISMRVAGTANLLPTGKILITGGYDHFENGKPVAGATIEVYDPDTGKSTLTGSLAQARAFQIGVTLEDGRVLVAGGIPDRDGAPLRSAELVDPATGKASPAGEMLAGAVGPAVLLRDGRVLILDGFSSDGTPSDTAEVYVP
jgi:hypothetical protein